MEIEGQWVHFQVRHAFHPEPAELLHLLFGGRLLQGRVVAVTSGHGGHDYAVVSVDDVEEPVIVPLSKTRSSHLTSNDFGTEC